ncbi:MULTISPECIES: pentapeptide repeat-containing protein [unclassified Cyanobium]|uniref:pentapeptide repeat-containing protein n=1 Tax=unclassified Cyanobium TaxID=2627006 RepID=UPI0020CEE31E|nr:MULTISPECIES: pentapeptide repeat-containing protein [unclassified Cyanobium]MCP9833960.1 pentapeptide repeat-containing protein [Cyanobium sp. La Preciosa 7G6]MCP9936723.1 pentapeptide repeat-containing protein [Cyanobium sp. Aljojuca 7A6]
MTSVHGSARSQIHLRGLLFTGAALLALLLPGAVQGRNDDDLLRLLNQRNCPGCKLQDADLVHADLRDADLRGAKLQRANLGQARLDGARLEGADLRFTSLQGASLRGADLRGANLEGTDLRQSDLSGAQLDPGGLARSHWQDARGVAPTVLSYPELHNAGVTAALEGRHPQAEQLFSEAIRLQPEAAISWVARGLSRTEQGKTELAAQDINYAAVLYGQAGEEAQAKQLTSVAAAILKPNRKADQGSALGGQLLTGAAGFAQFVAPLALKFLLPLAF